VGRPVRLLLANLKFGGHVTRSGSGGGGRCADDVGVVSGVDHVHGEFGQRPEGLTALNTAQDAPSSALAASRQPHVLATN